jgi:hypothetical protein
MIRIALAVLLLLLPAWLIWVTVRAPMPAWKRAVLALAALAMIFGNPLANFFLLAPVDSFLQRRMLARAQGLIGAPEAQVRETLGKPWKMRQLDGPFWIMTYAPCRVCMKSYAQPFAVFLESGRVYAFRAGSD